MFRLTGHIMCALIPIKLKVQGLDNEIILAHNSLGLIFFTGVNICIHMWATQVNNPNKKNG